MLTTGRLDMKDLFADRPCLRKGRYGDFTCGFCDTARAIAEGTTYIVNDKVMPREEAIQYNLSLCVKAKEASELSPTVKEIRREGQRILKAGTNIRVQLKRKAGTRKLDGFVIECYADGNVKIYVHDLSAVKIVPADGFLTSRRGTTCK